ncbi:hypothetical protein [Pseudodonghicola xiamenensis]|uniref:hypothetical protein n=1 Tax=Pseudodonghicola xiamenensis TaxID=337702 RepID=UPI0012B5B0FD|nr:hypothetical protein [Pseudodonghicola xiamenensis]
MKALTGHQPIRLPKAGATGDPVTEQDRHHEATDKATRTFPTWATSSRMMEFGLTLLS